MRAEIELKEPIEQKRAVIYARYSSSGQREESIEGQLRDCYTFAKKNNFVVVGEYIDRALSGRTDKRPDFQRMLRDSERELFDTVITWKMDRFARNRYDSAKYKARLKLNGVSIFYAMETIPLGPEGIVLESVMEGFAEYYSANLSQNVKRGMYDSALELKTLGQKVIGYKKGADERFEIDPGAAAIVRRIFKEYAAGESAKDIYTRLNEEGHRTSRGGLFNKNSVRRILQNEKYIGVYAFEDIRVEGGVPAIVDRELFGKVQEMIVKNHASPGSKQGRGFLLTGKLFCGHCGSLMPGDSGTSKTGRVYAYYTCYKRRSGNTCDKERAPKEWIEDFVIDELVRLIRSDDFITEVADCAFAFQMRERDTSALAALETRKKDVERKIENIVLAIEDGLSTPSMRSRLVELESEKVSVSKGIAREKIEDPLIDHDTILLFLQELRKGDPEDDAYRAMLINTLLNSAFLYDDGRLILTLNYSGSQSKITLSIVEKNISHGGGASSSFAPSATPNGANTNSPAVLCFFEKVVAVVVRIPK